MSSKNNPSSELEDRPWVEKYRPTRLSDIFGNTAAVNNLKKWLSGWNSGKKSAKKAALLVGPAGVGKTSTALALANEMGWDVIEINASDKRNKKAIEQMLGAASQSKSLSGSKKLRMILVEEIDGMSGTDDRGGGSAVASLIKKASVPFICTANDPNSSRIAPVKKVAQIIEFKPAPVDALLELLKMILNREREELPTHIIKQIAENSGGDIRGAINDLQSAVQLQKMDGGKPLEKMTISNRNQAIELEEVISNIFQAHSFSEALQTTTGGPSDYRMLLALMNDHAYKHANSPTALAQIYEHVALADLNLARIINRQNWKLLKYFYMHLTAGISLTPGLKRSKINYGFPSYYRKLANAKFSLAKLNAIQQRSGNKLHVSKKEFRRWMAPTIKATLNGNDARIAAETIEFLDITEDEAYALGKEGNIVGQALKIAEQLRVEHISTALEKKPKGNPFQYWAAAIEEFAAATPPPTVEAKTKARKRSKKKAAEKSKPEEKEGTKPEQGKSEKTEEPEAKETEEPSPKEAKTKKPKAKATKERKPKQMTLDQLGIGSKKKETASKKSDAKKKTKSLDSFLSKD